VVQRVMYENDFRMILSKIVRFRKNVRHSRRMSKM